MLIARNWSEATLVDMANTLLEICDNHAPPFSVVFGRDPAAGLPGSSMDRGRAVISLATKAEDGSRRTRQTYSSRLLMRSDTCSTHRQRATRASGRIRPSTTHERWNVRKPHGAGRYRSCSKCPCGRVFKLLSSAREKRLLRGTMSSYMQACRNFAVRGERARAGRASPARSPGDRARAASRDLFLGHRHRRL